MNLDDLVSKRIALHEVNDGYAALQGGTLNRVVVTSFRRCSRDKETHHESSRRQSSDQDHYDPLH
jgi:hypothetical protein